MRVESLHEVLWFKGDGYESKPKTGDPQKKAGAAGWGWGRIWGGLGWVGWVGWLAWLGFVVDSTTLALTATIFIYSRA